MRKTNIFTRGFLISTAVAVLGLAACAAPLKEGEMSTRTFELKQRGDPRGPASDFNEIILGEELYITNDGNLAPGGLGGYTFTNIYISPDGKRALVVEYDGFDEDGRDVLVNECHEEIVNEKDVPDNLTGSHKVVLVEENCIATRFSTFKDIPREYQPLPTGFRK